MPTARPTHTAVTATTGRILTAMWFLRNRACNCALSLMRGNGVSGTGTPRNTHSGSHPSVTE
eukprot:16511-Heterococcus_DN1.PRE.2